MATFCLPRPYVDRFKQAQRRGEIDTAKLAAMSSPQRRAAFTKIVGNPDHAKEMNTLFESKLLLKNQKAGLETWARNVVGVPKETRKALLDKIRRMETVLQPADEQSFLKDLASKRIGVQITSDEAKKIWELSERARKARDIFERDILNVKAREDAGVAQIKLLTAIENMKPDMRSKFDKAAEVFGITRTLMTFGDFSAVLNQAWGSVTLRRAHQGYWKMFQSAWSEEKFERLQGGILAHPEYDLAKKAGLRLTDLSNILSKREEAIQFSLVERGEQRLGKWLSEKTGRDITSPFGIRASSRAFAGYLNYVRFYHFADLVAAARLSGEDISMTKHGNHDSKGLKNARDIARVVNDFTGSGNIGIDDKSASWGPILNAVLFAPRKISASLGVLSTPITSVLAYKRSRTARVAALKQLTGSVLATAAILSLAAAMGAEIEEDPTHTDFLRIKIANSTFDITGGHAAYIKLLARLISNKMTTSKGKVREYGTFGIGNRLDAIASFVRGKASPFAASVLDLIAGQNAIGEPFEYWKKGDALPMQDKILPMTVNTFWDWFEDEPEKAATAIPMLFTLFGVSGSTKDPDEKDKMSPGEARRLKERTLFETATGQDG